MQAIGSVQPEIEAQGDVCTPKFVQSSFAKTTHSELATVVPADKVQLLLPWVTSHFLTKVWSTVALLTPATDHPAPGSAFQSPTKSTITYPPVAGFVGEPGLAP